jgi:hypothetical protein
MIVIVSIYAVTASSTLTLPWASVTTGNQEPPGSAFDKLHVIESAVLATTILEQSRWAISILRGVCRLVPVMVSSVPEEIEKPVIKDCPSKYL